MAPVSATGSSSPRHLPSSSPQPRPGFAAGSPRAGSGGGCAPDTLQSQKPSSPSEQGKSKEKTGQGKGKEGNRHGGKATGLGNGRRQGNLLKTINSCYNQGFKLKPKP